MALPKGTVSGALLIALSACSAPGDRERANETAADTPIAAPARPAPPPCPTEQLSCGLQKPVISDGVHAFHNADMGLSAIFPAGDRVCMTRSGDAARGFYAVYQQGGRACEERPALVRYMSISSSYNATEERSLRGAAGDVCRPLAPAVTEALRGARLAIPGHSSLMCQWPETDDRIEIVVNAMAGRSSHAARDDAPIVIYWAALGTTPERLAEDLPRFRAFLRTVRIGAFGRAAAS